MPRGGGGQADGAARGRDAVLDVLFRQHRDAAMACAMSILRDRSLAEDAVQQGFTQIAISLERADVALVEANPRALVLRNTRWAAIRIAQRRRATPTCEEDAAGELTADDGDWQRAEARILCSTILEALPRHYRQALVLRHVDQEADNSAAAHLGVTVKAYRERLRRAVVMARSVGRNAGIAGAAEAVLLAWRRLRDAGRHAGPGLRHPNTTAAWRAFGPLAEAGSLQTLPLLAMGVVVLSSVSGPGSAAGVAGMAGAHVVSSRHIGNGDEGAGAVAELVRRSQAAQAAGGAQSTNVSGRSRPVPKAGHPAQLPSDASSETLDDVHVYSAAASPNYDQDHTIVAVGRGQTCNCMVTMITWDAGDSWHPGPGPAGGGIVVLPPNYPADSHIFIANPAGGGAFDYGTAAFGQEYSPLTTAPGMIALSPQFDDGDPTMLIAGTGTLWRYDTSSGLTRAILPAGQPAQIVTLATIPGEHGSVLVLTRTTVDPTLSGGVQALYSCTTSGECTELSDPPLGGTLTLVVSPDYSRDNTLLLYNNQSLAVSHDGGRSFTAVPRPASATSLFAASLLDEGQGVATLWLSTWDAAGNLALLDLGPTGWRTVVAPLAQFGPETAVATTPDEVIAVRAGFGLLFAPRG